MKKEDYIIGEYYFLEFFNSKHNCWIIKITKEHELMQYGNYISTEGRHYTANSTLGNIKDVTKARVAKKEERDWLHTCIRAGKFVPKETGIVPELYKIY